MTNVQFNGINKDSGDDGGYADHTGSVSDDVVPGQSYELSVTLNTGGYSEYVTVAIDWNQNYDLSDDEVIQVGNGESDPLTVTKDITVPSDVAEGQTRMRVMQNFESYHTDPTSNQDYGETEDYTVSIGTDSDDGGGGNEAPTADFSYSPTAPKVDETVQFTDASSDSDGSIASYSWDLGDGTTSSEAEPSHSYSSSGTYTVELTVTDDDGATDSKTQSITVEYDDDGGGDEYSTVSGGDTSYDEFITNVQFNGINKDSGNDGGYEDHTGSVSNDVTPGQAYELSVTLSTGGYPEYVTVAIDWNQNYDLSDDEVIQVGNGDSDPLTLSTDITVPSDASEGQTRMRVMQNYESYHTDPTSNQDYGETEDYTVSIGTDSDDGGGGGDGVSTVFEDDFENSADAWSASGLWHLVDDADQYGDANSGSHSMWYGQDSTGDYDTGSQTTGSLSTSVDLTGASQAELVFNHWFETESYDGEYDQVKVLVNGEQVYYKDTSDPNVGSEDNFAEEKIDISSYTGETVDIEFVFDSVDGQSNDYQGWYVDDIAVNADV